MMYTEIASNLIFLSIYTFGFIKSLQAVNSLSESKVTVWAIKTHIEEKKKEFETYTKTETENNSHNTRSDASNSMSKVIDNLTYQPDSEEKERESFVFTHKTRSESLN